ncbi:hypothetical protein BDV29DRAFT_168383 [Aspergillus leporis]|uniref:Uncharacterized protein n=1 Tax=Aspergillus leporis TaxID=41062 RepID=A0A5N5XE58_9EURO|nr:hypothetical protein BDV29DRAFT_168383 [Aspergillus leporis]
MRQSLHPSPQVSICNQVPRILYSTLRKSFLKLLQLRPWSQERWNGPDRPTAEKNADQCIREWVSLNVLVAHLTRVHAVFLNTYAVRTFHRAFGSDPNEDKLDYQIPASAAWISNLGEQIYRWCRSAREVGEETQRPQTKMAAEMAWLQMSKLEMEELP